MTSLSHCHKWSHECDYMSHISHITMSQSHDHMLHWKSIEGSGRIVLYSIIKHMLTLRQTHGCLG